MGDPNQSDPDALEEFQELWDNYSRLHPYMYGPIKQARPTKPLFDGPFKYEGTFEFELTPEGRDFFDSLIRNTQPREENKMDIEQIGNIIKEATGHSLSVSRANTGWDAGFNGTTWVKGAVSPEVAMSQVVEQVLQKQRSYLNAKIEELAKLHQSVKLLERITLP